MKESEKVTIRLPASYVRTLDFLVEVEDFPSRSEAIRAAVRDMFYERVEIVMDKVEKLKKAESSTKRIEDFRAEYLHK
jgi:Arc/MetJ-type ribon-helix-helix transcriptional regulator